MLEPASLTLTIAHDNDGDHRVTADVSSGAFSGRGGAWFELGAVTEFVAALRELSDTGSGSAELIAGYFEPNGAESSPVRIAVAPRDRRGHLLVTVHLRTLPVVGPQTAFIEHRVKAAFEVEAAALSRFARSLSSIPIGTRAEATLAGESAA